MQDTVFGSMTGEIDSTGPVIDADQWHVIGLYVGTDARREAERAAQATRAAIGTVAGRKNARKR